MSSFWKFFSGEEGEGEETQTAADSAAEASPPGGSVKAEGVMKPSKSPPAASAGGATPQTPGVADGSRSAASAGSTRYGIDDAIRLMRTLPVEENVDLVVRVMKSTLESLKVRVGDIIDDASKRQDSLKKKINEYQTQIAQFEREIDARKHEIGRHEDELAETTKVKERLQIAETLAGTPQAPQAAGRVAPPLPMRSKPPPPDLPKKTPSIPPKNEIEGGSPSPSPSAEPRDVEKPS